MKEKALLVPLKGRRDAFEYVPLERMTQERLERAIREAVEAERKRHACSDTPTGTSKSPATR
jgi:hypothetical protein